MRAIIGFWFLVLAFTACATVRNDLGVIHPTCVQFSEPFLLAAQVREGRTLEQSLTLFQESRTKNPTESDLVAEKWMLATIRFVYKHADLPPKELQARVQKSCIVGSDGKVQFHGI